MTEAQQQLVLDHLEVAESEARRFRAPRWVARQELTAAAYWGLCLAAIQCQDLEGFPAYARISARNAIRKDLERSILFRIGPQARTDGAPIERKHLKSIPERSKRHDPLADLIRDEDLARLAGGLERLTPVRRAAIRARLAGATTHGAGASYRYAVEDLRGML